MMFKIIRLYNRTSLILRIIIGVIIGIVLAFAFPGAGWIGSAGTLFVRALKSVAPVLAVALVINLLIVGIALRTNPYPLVFRCIRGSGFTAFFTRSSAAEYVSWRKAGKSLPAFLGGSSELPDSSPQDKDN